MILHVITKTVISLLLDVTSRAPAPLLRLFALATPGEYEVSAGAILDRVFDNDGVLVRVQVNGPFTGVCELYLTPSMAVMAAAQVDVATGAKTEVRFRIMPSAKNISRLASAS